MNIEVRLAVFSIVAAASFVGVLIFRRTSLRRKWLDVPTDRSSHSEPTPRGAGIVVVVICLILFAILTQSHGIAFSLPYLLGGAAIAVTGWLDDLYRLPISVKFIIYFFVAVASVLFYGYWRSVGVSTKYSIDFHGFGPIITLIWLLWSINAFNFMDGIDGLAGLQGAIAAIAWSIVFAETGGGIFFAGVGGACLGLLILNWHPARVFMGDVGSSFLGYTFAIVPIAFFDRAEVSSPILPIVSIFFLWPVNFDAGWTRLIRALRGERFWQPNREHFYQILVDRGFSQLFVAALYGIFSVSSITATFIFLNGSDKAALVPIGFLLLVSIGFALTVYQIKKTSHNVER
jgi:UDP-N-acetylmuramyl pentapeptide phosphotransferase/UDP-N-acetylglucosamine-1-phosphate transferase